MKKLITLLLILCMLFSMLIPLQSFAQGRDELEGIIKAVKEKIDVPAKLTEFNYSVFTQQDKNVWNLTWSSKDGNDGSLNVGVSDDGTILNYNYYTGYYDPSNQQKLPKLSRQDAQKAAEDFIKKINPNIFPQLKLDENNQQNLMSSTYSFNYYRMVNNIPFRDNNVSVDVNSQEGYVQSYYSNWSDGLNFPSPDKAISLDDAKKAYGENLGLELVYNYRTENQKIITYLSYQPKYSNYYIDAFTGEKVQLQTNYYRKGIAGSMNMAEKSDSASLTPQEQKAVDEVANVITRDQAEKIARDNQLFGLTDAFKLNNSGLYKDWLPSSDLVWSLDFSNNDNDNYRSVSIRIDAKTGEITSFYINAPIDSNASAKFSKEQSKASVEKFLNDFCPDKFKNTVFDDNYDGYIVPLESPDQKELPKSYNFRYIRKVNEIPFIGNSLNVGFDAVNGKVTSLDSQWFDADFASPDKVISIDKAYDTLFSDVGYELQYKLKYGNEMPMKFGRPPNDTKPEVKLVYGVGTQKPSVIDAIKGTILNYDGTPYIDKNSVEYTDIDNSYAKDEINFLAEYGISFSGKTFKPTFKITQKGFLYLIEKAQNPYEQYVLTDPKDTDRLYENLIRSGIIKEAEKAPDSFLIKEDAAKFIIRALKYDKIAELKNVLNCNFADEGSINPDLIGYAVLANGLGVVQADDGKFNPKSNVTREQAAVMIYNFLK